MGFTEEQFQARSEALVRSRDSMQANLLGAIHYLSQVETWMLTRDNIYHAERSMSNAEGCLARVRAEIDSHREEAFG